MSSDERAYLVTQLATDVNPPRAVQGHHCPTRRDAIGVLTECLDFHDSDGAANTRVQRNRTV